MRFKNRGKMTFARMRCVLFSAVKRIKTRIKFQFLNLFKLDKLKYYYLEQRSRLTVRYKLNHSQSYYNQNDSTLLDKYNKI